MDNYVVNSICTSGAADDVYGYDEWGDNTDAYNVLANSGETSCATGCSSQGQFQVNLFQGSFCDGLHYQETITSPSDLSEYGTYTLL